MTEHVTDSGIVVVDRRSESTRAFGREGPNGNPPVGTVGPDVATGGQVTTTGAPPAGAAEPPQPPTVQPWAGWPEDWQTPMWNQGVGLQARVSTVFTCVELNSSALGSMTPGLTEIDGRKLSNYEREWVINPQPELYSDWSDFMQTAAVSWDLRGNVFVRATARYSDGRPARFFVMDPDAVHVEWRDGVRAYTDLSGARIPTEDLLHLRGLTPPGATLGLSPLEGAAGNLVSAAALERYGAQLAAKGGVPWAVLDSPDRLTAGQSGELQRSWVSSAARRDGAPAVLSGGLTLKTLTLSPKDMALLDLRVFDEQRIAACLGVPPFLAGLPQPEGLTYANATSLFDFHHRRKLKPTGSRFTTSLSAWALPFGQTVTINASEYTEGSQSERVATWLPALQLGAITPAEFRALVGLPPATGASAAAIASQTSGTQ